MPGSTVRSPRSNHSNSFWYGMQAQVFTLDGWNSQGVGVISFLITDLMQDAVRSIMLLISVDIQTMTPSEAFDFQRLHL